MIDTTVDAASEFHANGGAAVRKVGPSRGRHRRCHPLRRHLLRGRHHLTDEIQYEFGVRIGIPTTAHPLLVGLC